MKEENWNRIETYLEGINMDLNDLRDGEIEVLVAVSNIRGFVEDIYTVCEDDYCDSTDETLSPQYDEVVTLFPDANLSLGELLSLKETIQKWRDEHGYPNP